MRCSGITKAKELCGNEATMGSYCWHHAPETADERHRRASRGGKAGGNGRGRAGGFGRGEFGDLKAQLADLYDETLEGNVDRGVAAVLAQIVNARTRLLDFEHRRDAPDLITRQQLEGTMAAVVEVLRRHVTERHVMAAISADFEELMEGTGAVK